MGRKGNIAALVAAAAAGESLPSIAAASGLSVSSVQRRLADPNVEGLVRQAQADLTRQSVARIRGLRDKGLERLDELLGADIDASLTLRTVELVLRHAAASDTVELQQRMLEIENRLSALSSDDSSSGHRDG